MTDETTPSLDAGTYEVLRARLGEQAKELARRAEELNARRLEVFGGVELRLVGAGRIRTEQNCVPRDIAALGDLLLFGYNTVAGTQVETSVSDVFALHRFSRDGFRFEPADSGTLADPDFRRDFAELYRYYRDSRLLQLRRVESRLLAVFQTGLAAEHDTRVLRWNAGPEGVVYQDNLGEADHVFPPPHDFAWTETTRDDHVPGRHPHIAIEGEVFVETIGGDLTVKVDDDTETGEGIYREPVAEPLQSLADAEVEYARVGALILLRIRPYKEDERRHLVFNTRTRTVVRLDGIGQACRRLPEDQGIIFPGGYCLASGAVKTFDTDTSRLEYERVIRSTNGEDVLYVFHARESGRYLLLPYNVIRKEAGTPIACHGHALFDDGTLVVFRAESAEPARVHQLQVWQTPYLSDAYAATQPVGTGPLERIGNVDLVRGISDSLAVARTVTEATPSARAYEELIAACDRAFDHYFWIAEQGLREPLDGVRDAAVQVLEEFATVQALTAQAADALEETAGRITTLIRRTRGDSPGAADAWVTRLAELRRAQGRLVTLREMRYADLPAIDGLAGRLAEELTATGRRAVAFLEGPDAFDGYHEEIGRLVATAEAIATVAEAEHVRSRLAEQTHGLETLTEVVGALDIADATARTAILERVGAVLAEINHAQASLAARRRELLDSEGRAAFAAEFALLGQAVTAALAMAGTPAHCDDQLGRMMLQLENLESRYAEFDDFVAELSVRREEVYEAFSARKQALVDEQVRRADRLAESARRILAGVVRRVADLDSLDEVNTYFAADPMVAKVRDVAGRLRDLGDPVRAGELEGRLKAARQDAGRMLRDRVDLYEGGTLRLGRHRFAVSTQPVDLTLVPYEGGMAYAVTGTDYRQHVRDAAFEETRPYWEQTLVSETPSVYRAEYLAASLLDRPSPEALGGLTEDELLAAVRRVAETRYDEGYERGVHDRDAALILGALLRLHSGAGLLRYPPEARAAAQLFWAHGASSAERTSWAARARSLARARAAFGDAPAAGGLSAELAAAVASFAETTRLAGLDGGHDLAGEYLFEELARAPEGFVTGAGARTVLDGFGRALGGAPGFAEELRELDDLAARHELVSAWLGSYLRTAGGPADDLAEAVAITLCGSLARYESAAGLTTTVTGLLGTHPRVGGRRLELRLDEVLSRTRRFRTARVPAYRAYQRRRGELIAAERSRLRLEEYRPKPMSGFVRNGLLDEVYLPLIGDSLAKQLGAAGGRTDQLGLLLLVSPPGYGKTTLMEYVAARLGLMFVKVNGPALGRSVTSLDPAAAPDATARQEVEKISFALEMGNNVLLYLDDIQHVSAELLQRFVSLCDAQRRIEGVWEGRTRTYDLRGKRFAVCMAGNPFTESGQRFRIPDMLANRADVWNLGDVLAGREELFALSYVENALTSNPVLAPLSARDRGDVELLVRLARGDATALPDRLAHPYSTAELGQILAVLRNLLRVQQVVLACNRAYIASAARSDAARTEPPFRLQGSYRNMNKLAERIVPVMNEAELEAVIDDHYLGEAQTLASGAEANLLKLAELRGTLTDDQRERWTEVKAAYVRSQALGGAEDDPLTRAVGALGLLADRMAAVETAIRAGRPERGESSPG